MDGLRVIDNRYQLLSVIKKGGFGIVYKGYDSVLGKDIAVKEILPDLSADKRFQDLFRTEARQVARMNHQNIVHIFDLVHSEDDKFFIIMEYIDGFDLNRLLRECLKRGELIPQHIAVHIVAEVCKALDYAHNCSSTDNNEPLNLVHQDVSPSNIMVSKTGIVKLIDFGIAGMQKRAAGDSGTIPLQGKIQYMSPEHVGIETVLDRRSDLFSLGLVLYEVLEGQRYLSSTDPQAIIESLQNGRIKTRDFKKTPRRLQSVLLKALEKEPERRYQNANQFYIDLVTHLVTEADTSRIDSEISDLVRQLNESGAKTSLDRPPARDTQDRAVTFESKTPRPLTESIIIDSPKPFGLTESDLILDDKFPDLSDLTSDLPKQPETETPPTPDARPEEEEIPDFFAFEDEQLEEIPDSITPPPVARTSESRDVTEVYTELGDEVKTVIDAVRLSTRGHKKLMIRGLLSFLGMTLLFFLLDIGFRWTPVGSEVYDLIFPPTIKLSSVPSGASVFLNGQAIEGQTPLSIDDIKPGVYELKLTVDGYNPIIKSLYIPSQGRVEIKGEHSRRGNQPYVFRFKTSVYIDSYPQGAAVFINNIKYGQRTPCSVTWEVGDPLQVELQLPDFARLSGFALDTQEMTEVIDDNRLWQFEVTRDPNIAGRVHGTFGKSFSITCNPPGAAVYLDDGASPIIKAGDGTNLFLSATQHKLRFVLDGYNSKTVVVDVKKETPAEVAVALSRPVEFRAYDATNGRDKDLQAVVSKVVRNGTAILRQKRTPATLNLLPYTYEAHFSKKDYRDTVVQISPDDRVVVAKMEPTNASYSIVVVERNTGNPLSNVEVRYKSLDRPDSPEGLLDITDGEGAFSGSLTPGLYIFRTSKSGFKYQEQTIMVQPQGLNLIEFSLEKR